MEELLKLYTTEKKVSNCSAQQLDFFTLTNNFLLIKFYTFWNCSQTNIFFKKVILLPDPNKDCFFLEKIKRSCNHLQPIIEVESYESTVTDWELKRYFERI